MLPLSIALSVCLVVVMVLNDRRHERMMTLFTDHARRTQVEASSQVQATARAIAEAVAAMHYPTSTPANPDVPPADEPDEPIADEPDDLDPTDFYMPTEAQYREQGVIFSRHEASPFGIPGMVPAHRREVAS